MALTDRALRKLINTKQSSIEFDGIPSVNGMADGQVAIEKKSNSQLALYRKKYGKLWKMYMSSDGDQYVDRRLKTNTLEYTHRFIDYRTFIHNWKINFGTSEVFLPWAGTGDQTSMYFEQTAMIAPFKMTFHKMIFRPLDIDADVDLVFRIKTQANIASSVTTLASYTWAGATSSDLTLADRTNQFVYQSDWDNNPIVDAEKKVAISIQPGGDPAGETQWYATSIWRTEVVI